jgi:hypothetical protein
MLAPSAPTMDDLVRTLDLAPVSFIKHRIHMPPVEPYAYWANHKVQALIFDGGFVDDSLGT